VKGFFHEGSGLLPLTCELGVMEKGNGVVEVVI
jgi:hypothetical protein